MCLLLIVNINLNETFTILRHMVLFKPHYELGNWAIVDKNTNKMKISTDITPAPKWLIGCNTPCDAPEIKSAISEIRKRFKGGIFAAVTPTSIQWKFSYLVEHLIEEREWYLNKQKGRA